MRFRQSSLLSTESRKLIFRVILLIGSIGPGIALTVSPTVWGSAPILAQLAHLPVPLQFFGVSLLLASVLILFERFRDIGYAWIAMFYFVVNVSTGFALANSVHHLHGHGLSALMFIMPVVLGTYLESAISATRDREQILTVGSACDEEKG